MLAQAFMTGLGAASTNSPVDTTRRLIACRAPMLTGSRPRRRGRIQVDDGVELARQRHLVVVAHALGFQA